jgi:predicted kinase
MFDLAERTLAAGQAVSLDATFRESRWREAAEGVAAATGVVFDGRWLDLPVEVRRARVEARLKDVSDATPDIASAQADIDKSTISWQIEQP